MNQQKQYQQDVATGYPRPWELWEWNWTDKLKRESWKPCARKQYPINHRWVKFRRRQDADKLIRAWQDKQVKHKYNKLELAATVDMIEKADKFDLAKLVLDMRHALAEVLEIAETNTGQMSIKKHERNRATIAKAKELL